ncbi:MAG TPA: phosphomannomutase/phosphoglucomutase, partial [Firmicutes bacterium]|nr:phosphomannomutase/phosphoglucomutase [Bacillota bacterium]
MLRGTTMKIPNHIFREYDIRGVALEGYGKSVELTEAFTFCLGQAFGTILRGRRSEGNPRVVIGRDARKSGENLSDALSEGLRSCGVDVVRIGMVPTPCTYFAERFLDVDGAIQVTGSHNPVDMNGFKIQIGGASLYGEQIQNIRSVMEKGGFASGSGSESYLDILPRYIDIVTAAFEPMTGLKLVADCGNGTSGPVVIPAFSRLGIDASVLFPEPDGTFPNHHPDPTVEKNLIDLKASVANEKAWLGVAFDGDSDRLGAVDENGKILWGDQLLILFARDILQRRPGAAIVGEVKCSKILYDEIAKAGGKPEMYRTGHSLIKARMKEIGAELAGEMSGHLFFHDRWLGFDDANYAALRLAELVFQAGVPLGELTRDIPTLKSTPEI